MKRYKIPPWHPELETFNTLTSLCAEDIKYLQEWGFTAIRLGFYFSFNIIYSSFLFYFYNNKKK